MVAIPGTWFPDALQNSDHWIDLSEGRLFARSWQPEKRAGPERDAILLFHDSLGCVDLWREFPEQLAQATGRRVIAYDRLGFGRSSPRHDQLTEDFVRAEGTISVPALCGQLGLDSVVALGHSVGGAMAVVAAARGPVPCRALVTVSAQTFAETLTLDSIREARTAFREPGQIERLARYHGDRARWVLDAWTETWLSAEFASWTLDGDLANVRCPVLALHGDRDEYGSRCHPERIAELAGGRAVIIEDCGHIPYRDRPQAVLAEVTRFLDDPAVRAMKARPGSGSAPHRRINGCPRR